MHNIVQPSKDQILTNNLNTQAFLWFFSHNGLGKNSERSFYRTRLKSLFHGSACPAYLMLRWALHLDGLKRAYHAAVAAGHKVYSFGGYGTTFMSASGQIDVHVFNTVSLRWAKLPPVTTGRGERPPEVSSMRYGHTAVLIQDDVYIWGGMEIHQACNTLHGFEVDTHRWSKPKVPTGTVPGARYGHSACVLGVYMYIFGGYNRQTGHSNDVYKLNTSTMVWSLIDPRNTLTPASQYHSATFIGTKMFVFGGHGTDADHYNSIRVFDTVTNCWQSTVAQPLPEGREGHSAFAYNGELYIFGGRNFQLRRTFNDLWKFNPETFSWKKVEPKGKYPCWRSRMCSCMVGERMVLFGGYRYRYTPNEVCHLEDDDDEYVYDTEVSDLYILDPSPSLKTLCKIAVIQYNLGQSGLPYDIRWELAAMTTNGNR